MKRDAVDAPLRRFFRVVLSVADHRVADGGKLHSNLILQSRRQGDPQQRCGAQSAFDAVVKLRPRRLPRGLRDQPLKHSLPPEIVHQRCLCRLQVSANHRQILPHGSVAEKLPDQRLPVLLGFCEEHHPRREAVNAMDDKSPFSLRFPFPRNQGPCRGLIRTFYRNRRKPGRLIEGHDGIIFIEDGKPARPARLSLRRHMMLPTLSAFVT